MFIVLRHFLLISCIENQRMLPSFISQFDEAIQWWQNGSFGVTAAFRVVALCLP
jgi:hypothetical protein